MLRTLALAAVAATLAGCASQSSRNFDPETAPEAIRVPAGNRLAFEAVGVGKLTYECQQNYDKPTEFRWVVVGPDAVLSDRSDRVVGKYYGPPATWDNLDGSRVTGTQVATAPGAAGSIALQLVKADPSTGNGAFTNVTYIQRVATKGGVVPPDTCNEMANGTKADARYQADYIFWKAR